MGEVAIHPAEYFSKDDHFGIETVTKDVLLDGTCDYRGLSRETRAHESVEMEARHRRSSRTRKFQQEVVIFCLAEIKDCRCDCIRQGRDRLLAGDVAEEFFRLVLKQAQRKRLLSSEHFTVDGTLIEAWAGQKSFQPRDNDDILKPPPPPNPGSNPTINYRKQKRSNQTHQSTTDPFARLFKKSKGSEAKLCYFGHLMTENRKWIGGEHASNFGHGDSRTGCGCRDGA